MLKKIRLCLLFSIISLHFSFPSLAMNNDHDQEVRSRITRKIAKYELKIRDLTRFLEALQINEGNETPIPTTPPREVIDPPVPTTPTHVPLPIPHPVTEITQDQIRGHLRAMYDSGNYTYATLGELLGYEPDKTESTPNGKSTGKTAVKRILDGTPSPGICERFRERVRNGTIPFPTAVTPTTKRTNKTVPQPITPILSSPVAPPTRETTSVIRSPATPITLPRAATSTMRGTTFVTPLPTQYAVEGEPYDSDNDPILNPHGGFFYGEDEDYSSDEANPFHND